MGLFSVGKWVNNRMLRRKLEQLETTMADHRVNLNNQKALEGLYDLSVNLVHVPIRNQLLYGETFTLYSQTAGEFLTQLTMIRHFIETGEIDLSKVTSRKAPHDSTIYDWCTSEDNYILDFYEFIDSVRSEFRYIVQLLSKENEQHKRIRQRLNQGTVSYVVGELLRVAHLYLSLMKNSL